MPVCSNQTLWWRNLQIWTLWSSLPSQIRSHQNRLYDRGRMLGKHNKIINILTIFVKYSMNKIVLIEQIDLMILSFSTQFKIIFVQTPSSYLIRLQSYELLQCLFSFVLLFFASYFCLCLDFIFADFSLHGPYNLINGHPWPFSYKAQNQMLCCPQWPTLKCGKIGSAFFSCFFFLLKKIKLKKLKFNNERGLQIVSTCSKFGAS